MAVFFHVLLCIVLLLLQHCYTKKRCRDFTEFVPKSVIQETGALFHFSKCSKDTNCSACSDNDASQIIHDANICEDEHNGVCKNKVALPHTDRHFSVHIPGDRFDHADRYVYNLTYQYSCESEQPYNQSLLCLQQFHLSLGVTDFNLKLTSSQAIVEVDGNDAIVSLKEGDTVTLECSSGLPNEANIPVHFLFTPYSNPDTETVMICEAFYHKPMRYGDIWVVERLRHDPHSCLLHVNGVSQNESGTYGCVGVLPHGLGDWSERNISIILASEIETRSPISNPTTFSAILGAIFGTFVSFIAVTLIGFCLVVVARINKWQQERRPEPPPEQTRPGRYGAAGQTASLVEEQTGSEGSDTEVEDDPPTVIPNERVDVEVDVEPSFNNATPQPTIISLDVSLQANTGPQASTGPQANITSPLPTASDPSQANITPRDPPQATGSEPPLQPTVIPACNPDSPESTLVLQIGGPPNRNGNRFPPDFVLEPPEITVSPEDAPPGPMSLTESHKSGESSNTSNSQLLFHVSLENISKSMTESEAGDGYPSHTSNSLTDSEDTKAVKIYHNQTHLSLAEGETPKSQVPIDPNYTCPKCHKSYAGDLRQYFTRHIEECGKPVKTE